MNDKDTEWYEHSIAVLELIEPQIKLGVVTDSYIKDKLPAVQDSLKFILRDLYKLSIIKIKEEGTTGGRIYISDLHPNWRKILQENEQNKIATTNINLTENQKGQYHCIKFYYENEGCHSQPELKDYFEKKGIHLVYIKAEIIAGLK
jgi:transcription initiation factor IIE alpha subunit